MHRQFTCFVAVVAALVAGGCLQKEETHTLYLSPDGRVVWSALEKDVYSDKVERAAAAAEEAEYLASARRGEHELAGDLARLGSSSVRTRVLRTTRPFAVLTTAEFADVGVLFDRLLSACEIPGYARLDRDGPHTTLRIHAVPGADADGFASLFEGVKLVLTDGSIVSAAGFAIGDGGRSAVWEKTAAEEAGARGGVLDLSLTWVR